MNQETNWPWMKECVERCQAMLHTKGRDIEQQLKKEWQWFMDQWSQKQEVKSALEWIKNQDLSQECVHKKINLWMNKGLQMWGYVWGEVSWCQGNFYHSYLWANAVKKFFFEGGVWEGWRIWIFSGVGGGWLSEWKKTWATWLPESDQWQKCIMTIEDERVLADVRYIWTQSGFIKQALKLARSLGRLQFKKESEHDFLSGLSEMMESNQISTNQKEEWLDFLMIHCKVHPYWVSRGMMYQSYNFKETKECLDIWKSRVWAKIKNEDCLVRPKQKKIEPLDWLEKAGKNKLLPLLVESGWIIHVLDEPELLNWDWSLRVGFRRQNLWAWSLECWHEENKEWTQWVHKHHAHWVESRQGVMLALAMKQKEMLMLLNDTIQKKMSCQRGKAFWIESIDFGLAYQKTQSINAIIQAKNALNPFASHHGVQLKNKVSNMRDEEMAFIRDLLEWVSEKIKGLVLKKKEWHWRSLLEWCDQQEKAGHFSQLKRSIDECKAWCALQEKKELEFELNEKKCEANGEVKRNKIRL